MKSSKALMHGAEEMQVYTNLGIYKVNYVRVLLLQGNLNPMLTSIWYVLAMSILFLPILAAAVSERETIAKIVQYLSGVSPFNYWMASFCCDQSLVLLLCTVASIIARNTSPINHKSADIQNCQTGLFAVYGVTMLPVCYALSFHFENHTKALLFILTTCLTTGIALVVILFILTEIKYYVTVTWCDIFFNIFPPYAFAAGILYPQQTFYRINILDALYQNGYHG